MQMTQENRFLFRMQWHKNMGFLKICEIWHWPTCRMSGWCYLFNYTACICFLCLDSPLILVQIFVHLLHWKLLAFSWASSGCFEILCLVKPLFGFTLPKLFFPQISHEISTVASSMVTFSIFNLRISESTPWRAKLGWVEESCTLNLRLWQSMM